MTREQMIDRAVRDQLIPQWRHYFAAWPEELSTVVFRDTRTTALAAIRAEFRRIADEPGMACPNCGSTKHAWKVDGGSGICCDSFAGGCGYWGF